MRARSSGFSLGGLLRRGQRSVRNRTGLRPAEHPAVRVDVAKHRRPVRRPAPAVVVGNGGEGLEARREPLLEQLDARARSAAPAAKSGFRARHRLSLSRHVAAGHLYAASSVRPRANDDRAGDLVVDRLAPREEAPMNVIHSAARATARPERASEGDPRAVGHTDREPHRALADGDAVEQRRSPAKTRIDHEERERVSIVSPTSERTSPTTRKSRGGRRPPPPPTSEDDCGARRCGLR